MTTTKERYELKKDSLGRVFISLTNDYLFKYIFGMKKNHKYLEALLESYFGYENGYLSNKLKSYYEITLDKTRYINKSSRSDLVVYFNNMIINIEMYKVFDEEALSKSNYYIMLINTNQVEIGDNYRTFNKITQINFIGEDKIGIEEYIKTNTSLSSEPNIIHNIQLDKPEKYLYNQNERFYKFLKLFNAKSYEERDEIAKGDELLMELNNTIKDYCHNGNEMFLNDLYWQERIQRCEGRKEGIIQGKFEIAKKMLLETSDLNYISRMTDLSIEEITKLQKENTTEM